MRELKRVCWPLMTCSGTPIYIKNVDPAISLEGDEGQNTQNWLLLCLEDLQFIFSSRFTLRRSINNCSVCLTICTSLSWWLQRS